MRDKESNNPSQSRELHYVDLTVSSTKFKTPKMFGTITTKYNGMWNDACAGDSGGPLMIPDKDWEHRFVLIGSA